MKLILTYEGELPSLQNKRGKKGNERLHAIRQQLHPQLKEHWETDKFLSEWSMYRGDFARQYPNLSGEEPSASQGSERVPVMDLLPDAHKAGGFRFMPLVRKDWHLNCSLDVLFLRRDPPGSVVNHGDVDNRIKTLIDALRLPDANQLTDSIEPGHGEAPFFVLMEDDVLLTRLNVETQRLLSPAASSDDKSVKLVIRVEVTPYYYTMSNLSFG